MSTTTAVADGAPTRTYLNASYTVKSWLTTKDHKRIAIMFLVSIMFFFVVGAVAAGMIRVALVSPDDVLFTNDTYNKLFTIHGVVMIFLFLIPSIPATLGNFFIPMMIGARDLAFPRLNLLSWYIYVISGLLAVIVMLRGGVDTGWTFYTPYSSLFSHTQVTLTIVAVFFAGFSSIFTGLNFIVTIHKMRAPGMTWFRLPLFVWAHYATSIIMILGTPVIAITLVLVMVERVFGLPVFDPSRGGDPILFQHLFWFYSHPAVYIMILPSMGVVSEVIPCFSRKRIFGYHFIAFSSLAIAALGFLVWGHHMFVSGQSMYEGFVFSLLSFLVAIPSAVKVFNWTMTMYKGSIRFDTPMLYALGFIGLFVIGGLTGLFLASMSTDEHVTGTYFVVAHFHYIMVGGAIMGFLSGLHFWWPKMTGRMYSESWGRTAAILGFIGFNLTFMPQFIVGFLGMPRRYHHYMFAPEFQPYQLLSTGGSVVLALGYLLPACYLTYSLFRGQRAPANPWNAKGLEWTTSSPPPTDNFLVRPIVTEEPYAYDTEQSEREYREARTVPAGIARE